MIRKCAPNSETKEIKLVFPLQNQTKTIDNPT